ncbi:unnamed protein product [Spirodela intermedia]|uniref:HMG box domain-containing protein n=1 Tax=Spirodela intermedia TaxID=51605 RepID=A0A7I8IFS2_SPIIN|nr:unnamed protein product [Spirodela intermedia]CAA6655722.1 unnamed protein product [Spirodela intermedia]
MAGSKSNPPRARKRVEVDNNTLKRAKDGSAFTKCGACGKDVPVGLIDMHSCSLDSKIRMSLEAQVVENVAEVKKPPEKELRLLFPRTKKEKKEKKGKYSSKPKRPRQPSFSLFKDDFRKTFKSANPDCKSVSFVAKEGGEKWKSMTDEEKKPYVDRAAELKVEYGNSIGKQSAGDEVLAASGKEEEKEEAADEE